MANTIIIKKSSVGGKVPAAGDLSYGELAINYADAKLYFKKSDNSIASFIAGTPGAQAVSYTPTTPADWDPDPTTVQEALDALGAKQLPSQTGNSGKYLTTNGTTLSWATISAGGVSGNNTEVQFNNNGSFGASANLTWDGTTLSASNLSVQSVALTNGKLASATLTTTTTAADQVVDSVSASSVRTIKYLAQVTSGSEYQSTEILLIHNGTDVYLTTYGVIFTGAAALASFDAQVSGGNLQLLVTPENAATTIKVLRTSINT